MNSARTILHLDMDAFYASVEQRDHPELRGKPVIVGSPPTQRGVVCAASYEARKFGVRSAMPSVTAGRLCPKGIFVYPRMSHYREESKQIFQVLQHTGAAIEPMSIDEAYMDVSEIVSSLSSGDALEYADALALGRQIRERIFTERKLTASVGISSNKFLSKLASDFCKPNGLTVVPERDKVLFLRPMPVRAIHGIGKVSEQVLHAAGIFTIGDLQDFPGDLRKFVGSFGATLKQFAFGEDTRPIETSWEAKSISSEETFDRDTEDRPTLCATLKRQASEITEELKEKKLGAYTVQIKIRYGDFTTLTRQISVEEPLTEANEIYRLSCFLLAREKLVNRPLRLLGVGVSGLGEAMTRQLSLPFESMGGAK
ncbi:MAG: polymerase [Verrucomicrobiales bacterium]|nr:polymerase [Verrucomicrobiales bacterium]